MLNNVYFSPFVFDSTAKPMTQYSPNVNPYVAFPTNDVKIGDFMAASGYPVNADWSRLGREYMDMCKTELDLRDSLGNLSNLSYKISTVLEDDNLNESQKERLQEILDKVKEIEEYVKQAKSVEQKKAAIKSIEELAEEDVIDVDIESLVDEYNTKLVTERNIAMTDKVEELLKGNKDVFYIVGSAHMIGEDGIVDLLQKRGYTVTKL